MSSNKLARRNHYVPQWYQRRFLADGETHFNYLDLMPEKIPISSLKTYQRRAIMRWGTKRCFCHDDLYTIKYGRWITDAIEQLFFGPIDINGKMAVEFFCDYEMKDGVEEAFNWLVRYMSAQRFRTPRGLDYLKTILNARDQNIALIGMQYLFETYATMWTEGVWEIVRAARSSTKFLLTDNPVTFYNARAFPVSKDCLYPKDVELSCIGTRTIFPLSREACLIITHLQFIRNPWANPRKPRVNARAYAPTIVDLRNIQTGRELEEDEVRRINFILHRRATRYVAASRAEWLCPVQHVPTSNWSKLDDDWFLFPNLYKVPFSGGIIVGYEDGRSLVMDEHGRTPHHPNYQDKELEKWEWSQHLKAKKAWAVKRQGRSIAKVHQDSPENSGGDKIMFEDLKAHHTMREELRCRRSKQQRHR